MTSPAAKLTELQRATAKLGHATQYGTEQEISDARRDRTAANLQYQMAKALSGQPPLTPEQIKDACALLRRLAAPSDAPTP